MSKKVAVIGSGFAGMAAATSLADKGHRVTIFEKNDSAGGRARSFSENGFYFDMGPSWYWMPDVFEKYFSRFGKTPADYYKLKRLDPSYRVVFQDENWDIPAQPDNLSSFFEKIEPGSSRQLKKFLHEAKFKYDLGMHELVYKPGKSLIEFIDLRFIRGVFRLDVFQSISRHIRNHFKHPKLIQLLEFPVLFLGAMPKNTPALYSLMNYADMVLGTWFPLGGMHKIVEGMESLAREKGVEFCYNEEVLSIEVTDHLVSSIKTNKSVYLSDYLVANADYHHVEQHLLPQQFRQYDKAYWESRKMAPSSIIFYLGVNKKLPNLLHHTLFFDTDFEQHAKDIYQHPQWPSQPLFYVCCPTKTDRSLAPEGSENVFILIPVAPGLKDTEKIKEFYFELIMARLEKQTGITIRDHIVYKRSYAHSDFINDYHAFKGNAYGLANTLRQTAILKPSMKNKKIRNLFYTGQLTVPGPGVPPSLISGQIVASEVEKTISRT